MRWREEEIAVLLGGLHHRSCTQGSLPFTLESSDLIHLSDFNKILRILKLTMHAFGSAAGRLKHLNLRQQRHYL